MSLQGTVPTFGDKCMCEEMVTFKAQLCRTGYLLRKQTAFGFVVSVLLIRKLNGTTQYYKISAFRLTLAPAPFTSVGVSSDTS